jgi:hypothetical protein
VAVFLVDLIASLGSLDMSWLPLSRFESRAVCVAVCGLGARAAGLQYLKFVEWEQLHHSRLTAQDLYAGLLIEIAGFNMGNSCQDSRLT